MYGLHLLSRRVFNMRVSLAPAVIRVLANNAVRLSSLKVGAGHARVDIGELLDRGAPARGHTLAGLAALCLDVKVATLHLVRR